MISDPYLNQSDLEESGLPLSCTGKCMWADHHDWFWFYFWLANKVARTFSANDRALYCKINTIPNCLLNMSEKTTEKGTKAAYCEVRC